MFKVVWFFSFCYIIQLCFVVNDVDVFMFIVFLNDVVMIVNMKNEFLRYFVRVDGIVDGVDFIRWWKENEVEFLFWFVVVKFILLMQFLFVLFERVFFIFMMVFGYLQDFVL